MCPRHDLSFCACTTACLASDLLVSKGPRPHLWFLQSKQLILTLRVPALMFCFCMQNREFWGRITSIYGSQTSPVVLCIQNRVISITITSLYGSQPSSVNFGCKTASFGPEKQVSMGPRPQKSLCARKTA